MKRKDDAAAEAFDQWIRNDAFAGARVKEVREAELMPGGRARLTLFEKALRDGRPHPRLQVAVPPVSDPRPAEKAVRTEPHQGLGAQAFINWMQRELDKAAEHLSAADITGKEAPKGSRKYFRNNVRCQRTAALFEAFRERFGTHSVGWSPADRNRVLYALAVKEEDAYAQRVRFDDSSTGTYHSFGNDQPFVHFLEHILNSLPQEGGKAFASLPDEQQHSVRRQRDQARAHIDFLMRHKYAYKGITETDIERTLGGLLIDRNTRNIVSETPETEDGLTPAFELLRIPPRSRHEHKGEYVYRDGKTLRLQDGNETDFNAKRLRRIPLDPASITFVRAPHDKRLRKGMRFDWEGNGYVSKHKVGWISWAGHCDIKAVMEQLGITLADKPRLTEYRSDTGHTLHFDHHLLIEMFAAVLELGSVYELADGGGQMQRGIHRFGGFRNDTKPDRLQFYGYGQGNHFRWPLRGRYDDFQVRAIEEKDGPLDMNTVFLPWRPDLTKVDFDTNPRFVKTLDGEPDYNLIDVSGAKLEIAVKVDEFDKSSGYPVTRNKTLKLDLSAEAGAEPQFLGTHLQDPARREIYRVRYDPKAPAIIAELERWEKKGDKYAPVRVPADDVRINLEAPVRVTLSREVRRDDPAAFETLINEGLRQGRNICADTDDTAEVWNGVVTELDASKIAENREARVEHRKVKIKARFGSATSEYLVRRDEQGKPIAFCPARGEKERNKSPDFLWQEYPDVGSKGLERGEWIVNSSMKERGIVRVRALPGEEGDFFVEDDHVKNIFEMLFCGLGGYPFTIVHNNKRYGFSKESAWKKALDEVGALRARLGFSGKGSDAPWPEPEQLGRPVPPAGTDGPDEG